MPPSNGDGFHNFAESEFSAAAHFDGPGAAEETEPELEVGPRAERPNFLTATRFVDFDLPPEIMEGLDNAGFEYCTPIQAQAIPVAIKGLDIAGQAQTGTGKTTAFLVPLLNRLLKNKPLEPGVPRAIIVTPTRELALQIYEDARVLAQNTSLKQVLVIGGMEYREQADILRTAPEIVICTPGRVIDYIQQGIFKTRGIEIAVVDEADRLLDMGFIKDLKIILSKLPPFTSRQTMLFSATLDDRVLELTYQYMNPPQYITAEPDKSTKVNIEQELYHIGRDEKLPLLLGLLRREEHRRVIIFSNTKSGVEWLSKKLVMNGFQAEGITGDLPQPKRLKLMEAFKENRLQILVATDVASRGIHVDDVSHVYNYDLPQDAENYIHRIGRTARAGHSGKAVSFGCEDYVFHLEAIENLLGEKIPVFWPEAASFQKDQGGEVFLKDRRAGDRDKRRREGARTAEGRREGPPPRSSSRGPAKSHRAGGIFGLSPRLSSGNGLDSARQTLDWSLEESPLIEPDFLEMNAAGSEPGQEKEKEGQGRRRKRRRNKRDRAEGTIAGHAMDVEPDTGPEAAEAAQEGQKPLETVPEPPRTDEKPAPKPSRRPRQAALKAVPPEPPSEAASVERAPQAAVEKTASEKPKRARPKKAEEKPAAAPLEPVKKAKKAAAPKTAAKKTGAGEALETAEKPKKTAAKKTVKEKAAEEKPAVKKSAAKKEGAAALNEEVRPVKKAAPKKAAASGAEKAKINKPEKAESKTAAPKKAPAKKTAERKKKAE